MGSPSQGKANVYYGTIATNANVVCGPYSGSPDRVSIQLVTDGTAVITYSLQVSNVATNNQPSKQTDRDDTYASRDWVTVKSGSVAIGAYTATESISDMAYRHSRLIMNNASGAASSTVKAYINFVSDY